MSVETHPNYWAIWAWLAGLTVVEVIFALDSPLPEIVMILGLLAMAIWKALLVALYFMHLRFEGNRTRIFAVAPLPLTLFIVVAVLKDWVW